MSDSQSYAKVSVTGQSGGRQVTQNYATPVRSNELYRNAVLRLSGMAINHFTRNHNTGDRRPSFREIPGGPFANPGGAFVLR